MLLKLYDIRTCWDVLVCPIFLTNFTPVFVVHLMMNQKSRIVEKPI